MSATALEPAPCGHPSTPDPVAAALGVVLPCPYPACSGARGLGTPWIILPIARNAAGRAAVVDPAVYTIRGPSMELEGVVLFRRVSVATGLGRDLWLWQRTDTLGNEP